METPPSDVLQLRKIFPIVFGYLITSFITWAISCVWSVKKIPSGHMGVIRKRGCSKISIINQSTTTINSLRETLYFIPKLPVSRELEIVTSSSDGCNVTAKIRTFFVLNRKILCKFLETNHDLTVLHTEVLLPAVRSAVISVVSQLEAISIHRNLAQLQKKFDQELNLEVKSGLAKIDMEDLVITTSVAQLLLGLEKEILGPLQRNLALEMEAKNAILENDICKKKAEQESKRKDRLSESNTEREIKRINKLVEEIKKDQNFLKILIVENICNSEELESIFLKIKSFNNLEKN